jgi:mycothiol system anti-sigma-R factor
VDEVMTCAAAVARLWAFLDHELDDNDHRSVEAHMALCRRCCGELEFAKHLQALLAANSGGDLPVGVRARLDRFIEGLPDAAGGGGMA